MHVPVVDLDAHMGTAFQNGEGFMTCFYPDILPAGSEATTRRGRVLYGKSLEWEEEEGVGRLFLSFAVAGKGFTAYKVLSPMSWCENFPAPSSILHQLETHSKSQPPDLEMSF